MSTDRFCAAQHEKPKKQTAEESPESKEVTGNEQNHTDELNSIRQFHAGLCKGGEGNHGHDQNRLGDEPAGVDRELAEYQSANH